MRDARAALIDCLGQPILAAGGDELRFECPLCPTVAGHPDGKCRLYVNPDARLRHGGVGGYSCKHCGSSGSLRGLLSRLGVRVRNPRLSWADLMRKLLKEVQQAVGEVPEPINPPRGEYHRITAGMRAYDYLVEDRGLWEEAIEDHGLGLGTGSLSDRIVCPILDGRGRWLDYTARLYPDDSHSNRPKYKRSRAAKAAPSLVYNLHRAREERRIVIVEGVFDAIMAGDEGAALLGKTCSPGQLETLLRTGIQEFVVALDPEALQDALNLARRLHACGRVARLATLPAGEDPASLGPERFSGVVEGARRIGRGDELVIQLEALRWS